MKKDRIKKIFKRDFFDEILLRRDGVDIRKIRGLFGVRFYDRQMKDQTYLKTKAPHFFCDSDDAKDLKRGDLLVFDGSSYPISAINKAETGLTTVELFEEYEGDLSSKDGGDRVEKEGSFLDKLKR